MFECTLYAYSTSPHVSQLYTGFSELAEMGKIKLTQALTNYSCHNFSTLSQLKPHALNGVFATLGNKKVLFYDTSDSPLINVEAAQIAQVYFKRSYVSSNIPAPYQDRILPLGFNYELYSGNLNKYEIQRFLRRRSMFDNFPRDLIVKIAELCSVAFLPTARCMHASPSPGQENRVLFMTRCWDPNEKEYDLSQVEREERHVLNETRAQCIRFLKKEYGSNFYGGFSPSAFTAKNYGDLILDDPLSYRKETYVKLMRGYPICISTMGLSGSIGWKMGEYVAFSKAIVSEKLSCVVPGTFLAGRNYLEFVTPEQCVHQTARLFDDHSLRLSLMENNWNYYQSHLAPSQLVLRTLEIAQTM